MSVRLRASLIVEYEADPKDYGTSDPVEMAKIDADNCNDDIGTFLNISGADSELRVEPV